MAFKDARKATGLYPAEVIRAEAISPHFVRVTVGSERIGELPQHGFDQWFRLFLPQTGNELNFSKIPEQFGVGGYLRYLTTPSGVRPIVRSYTVSEHRPAANELDIDFVVHGENGVAGPWACRAQPGDQLALLDQGRGFDPADNADFTLLVGDESAAPGILGILRDLPREARGLAIIEVPETGDILPVDAPRDFAVHWHTRSDPHDRAGVVALEALQDFTPKNPATLWGYTVGEQALATGGRRHLVGLGVPKNRITFVGYWRYGKSAA